MGERNPDGGADVVLIQCLSCVVRVPSSPCSVRADGWMRVKSLWMFPASTQALSKFL